MKYEDICRGVTTIYKKVQMKSRLEANIAFFLDELGIKWKYEPKSFLLSNRKHYMPDFYLPELNCFVEAKGVITKEVKETLEIFAKETKNEILCLSAKKGFYLELWDTGDVCWGDTIQIGKCSHCGSFFFCNNIGSYHCRKCGKHEGDHDLKTCDMFNEYNTYDYFPPNFSGCQVFTNNFIGWLIRGA